MANPVNVNDLTAVDVQYRRLIRQLRNNRVERAEYDFDFANHDPNEAYPQFQELIDALEMNKGFGGEHCRLKRLRLDGLFKRSPHNLEHMLPNDMNNRRRNFFRALSRCLRHHPTLQHLELNYNGIDDDVVRDSFYSAFEEQWFPALENLCLRANNIAGRWCETLLCNDTLKELDLGTNPLESDCATAIISFLVSTRCKLQAIYLPYQPISKEGYVAICNSLMSTGRPLSRLGFKEYRDTMDDEIVEIFAALLRQEKCSLRELELRCNISHNGMITLSNALITNKWLEKVCLDSHDLQGDAVIEQFTVAFEAVVRRNATLNYITLTGFDFPVGDSFVGAIASALEQSNYMLEHFFSVSFSVEQRLHPILYRNRKIKRFHDELVEKYHELKEKEENRSFILPHCIERCNSKPGLIFSILKMCTNEIFGSRTTKKDKIIEEQRQEINRMKAVIAAKDAAIAAKDAEIAELKMWSKRGNKKRKQR